MDAAATFAGTPSNRLLGLHLLSRSPELCEIELPMRAEFLQEERVVHGGFLATLLDTAAVWLLWPDLPPDQVMTSIEFKVNFLAAGRGDGGALRARAVPLRTGRTIAVCESEAFQDGVRIAKGTFTYLLRSRTGKP